MHRPDGTSNQSIGLYLSKALYARIDPINGIASLRK